MANSIVLQNVPNADLIKKLAHLNPVLDYTFPIKTKEYLESEVGGKLLSELITDANTLYPTVMNKLSKQVVLNSFIADELDFIKEHQGDRFGDMIELMHVGLAKTYTFNPVNESNPFIREADDVKALYYVKDAMQYHRQTIMNSETRKAFTSAFGIGQLMTKKMQSMNDTAKLSRNEIKKSFIKLSEVNSAYELVSEPVDKTTSITFIKQLVDLVQKMKHNTHDYNAMNVLQATSPSDMILIVLDKYKSVLTVDMIVDTFNKEAVELPYRIEYVEELGSSKKPHTMEGVFDEPVGIIENAIGQIIHKDSYMLEVVEEYHDVQYNAEGRYSNHFYHKDYKAYINWFLPIVTLFVDELPTRVETSIWTKQRELDNATNPDVAGRSVPTKEKE